MATHHKTVRRAHEPGDCHEMTFSCYRRMPLLTNDEWRRMLAESVERAIQGHDFRLVAFVFMPEHVHLLVYPTILSPGSTSCSRRSSAPSPSESSRRWRRRGARSSAS